MLTEKTLKCIDCKEYFTFHEDEQLFFHERGWAPPIRCRPCRIKKAARKKVGLVPVRGTRGNRGGSRPPR
jgi:hypothetical protein